MTELLIRLMRKEGDGVVIAGYECRANGRILHAKPNKKNIREAALWYDIFSTKGWVDHDRIDQGTGIEVDGVKVFENDEILIAPGSNLKGIVAYRYAQWCIETDKDSNLIETLSFYKDWNLKITGIKGVAK